MARPHKNGLDYFPIDVDIFTDIKVRRILRDCGPTSVSVLLCLLCNIYRKGYYVGWTEDVCFVVAELIGTTEVAVLEVVKKATQVGFFDKRLFERHKILTSAGIQERFLKVVANNKRMRRDIDARYMLLPVNSAETRVYTEETEVYTEETAVNSEESTQRKGKERKEKERKEKESKLYSDDDDGARAHEHDGSAVVIGHYMDTIGSMPPPTVVAFVQGYLDHMSEDVIIDAIDRAAAENKRAWSYVNGILKRWKASGVHNMADVAREDEEFRQRKGIGSAKPQRGSSNIFLDMLNEEEAPE